MKILIDGRFVGIGESISRYTLEIVKGILELDKKNDYTLLIRPQGKELVASTWNKKPKNFQTKILDIAHYSFAEQTKLLKYLNQENFDLVHFAQFNHPIRYRGKFVVSVHDLTLLGHLYRMNPIKRWGFRMVMRSAVKNSSKIITISEYSKNDIANTYNIDPKKIEVTYLGVDEKFNNEVGSRELEVGKFKKKYGIAGDYILYTGMWKRHKNIVRMLKAFELYLTNKQKGVIASEAKQSKPSLQLVMVGKVDKNEPEVMAEIERINQSAKKLMPNGLKPIVTTGFVEEKELPIAYAGALFYCIPSLSEGFGLPPLEAMACGAPVISSKISAMPEVLDDAAEYFDPYSIESIVKTMHKVASDKKLRDELSKKGLERVKSYSWDKTAKETLEVYNNI